MSLAIDVDRVWQVLLADGWHEVERWKDGRLSFAMDAYEYVENHEGDEYKPASFTLLLGGGAVKGVPCTGFSFTEKVKGKLVKTFGPITAVLAVRYEGD